MDKNLLLAIVLSVLVLIGHRILFPPPAPEPSEQQTAAATQAQSVSPAQASSLPPAKQPRLQNPSAQLGTPPQPLPTAEEGRTLSLTTNRYRVGVNTQNGVLTSFALNDYSLYNRTEIPLYEYPYRWIQGSTPKKTLYDTDLLVDMVDQKVSEPSFPLEVALGAQKENIIYASRVEKNSGNTGTNTETTLTLVGDSASGLRITKAIVFSDDNYILKLSLTLQNIGDITQSITPSLQIGVGGTMSEQEYNSQPKMGVALIGSDLETFDDMEELPQGLSDYRWVGVMDTYFITAVKSIDDSIWRTRYEPVFSKLGNSPVLVPKLSLSGASLSLASGASKTYEFDFYIGPKVSAEMDKFDNTFNESLDLVLDIIARPMLSLLRTFHDWTGNWGLAIIMLTIIVRLLMFPLAYKGMKSMKRMSKLTPRMQALKEKHGKNKERLNKEIMELYKRNKINPVGGCLPLLLQIPIFIALYWALLPAIELRHSSFIWWIYDLSQADFTLILPLLMGASMLVQQRLTPMPATMEPLQQKMMRFFPVVMTLFFVTFPSGLVLYWVTSNIITIAQQLIFNRVAIKEVID